MRKILYIIVTIFAAGFTSCSYLDISPDLGLSEEDVFSKYREFKSFLDAAYDGGGKHASASDKAYQNLLYGSFPLRLDANDYR